MSRFYLTMDGGKSNSERLTRRGHGGAYATVAGWGGRVTVSPYDNGGKDFVRVVLGPWQSSGGGEQVLYDGPLDAKLPIAPATAVKTPEEAIEQLGAVTRAIRRSTAAELEADRKEDRKIADRIDGFDRDDLGESPDY
jgi:hypothetical protein